ncbi:heterokaryon incompatibility protein-domain-containing protein [Halenospora varia]|nr:heterokaryon incompatibility protein-domain-containing protein [Halenospora varia]
MNNYGQEYYHYRERESQNWDYIIDNTFAKDLFEMSPWNFPSKQPNSGQFCVACNNVVHIGIHVSISELRTTAINCQLCELLLYAIERVGKSDHEKIHIFKEGSALKTEVNGPRILRLCSDLASCDNHNDIQIGFPALLEATSPIYFELLRAWLRSCDRSHKCNTHDTRPESLLPTRLLYVGNPNPDSLALHTATQLGNEDYVALSHCWGKLPPEDKKKFCSTTENIRSRQTEFSINDLPRTFRDAVRVTRELGLQYLWIDSLCILQGNNEDWKREANRMEDVFSSAYCVIAASSATNSHEGFLRRGESRSRYVQIADALGKQIYVCEGMDDFENDVDKAPLNTRGWVLQERALSRRTIHFTANNTYWECGEGVCCENLNRLKSPEWKHYFLLDPIFPKRLHEAGPERTVDFINSLLENYSKRILTEPTDRLIAISGLQTRIARTLGCQERYGILERFLCRNLLWQRYDEQKIERIHNLKVPSWSWIAYQGGIRFIDVPFEQSDIRWNNDIRFDHWRKDTLIGSLGKFWKCTIKQKEIQHAILDSRGTEIGWLQFDVEDSTDIDLQRFIVIGRTGKGSSIEYYVLVVRPMGSGGEYERVGIGLIQASHVSKLKDDVRVV